MNIDFTQVSKRVPKLNVDAYLKACAEKLTDNEWTITNTVTGKGAKIIATKKGKGSAKFEHEAENDMHKARITLFKWRNSFWMPVTSDYANDVQTFLKDSFVVKYIGKS